MFAPQENNNNLFSGLGDFAKQLGTDWLYQKIGGDWLGIDKYKRAKDQDMTPFQEKLLSTLNTNNTLRPNSYQQNQYGGRYNGF